MAVLTVPTFQVLEHDGLELAHVPWEELEELDKGSQASLVLQLATSGDPTAPLGPCYVLVHVKHQVALEQG